MLFDNNADGEPEKRYMTFNIVPIRDGHGDEPGLISHAVDATPALSARRAVEARATELEPRNHAALDVVMSLQRSLLPEWLPVLPGVGLAARYLVADREHGAGGDWFDAVPLANGRLGLAVGDVVGSGTPASAVMGQLRAVLAELLLDCSDLSDVLARLDRVVVRMPGAAASTVCLAVLDPAKGQLNYVCCGHPPPLLLAAHGRAHYLPGGSGGPLGVATTTQVPVQTAWLQATDMVLFYTDGLVERLGRPLHEGLDLLRIVAEDARAGVTPSTRGAITPDRVCERAVERMTRDGHSDDVAILAIQNTGTHPPPFLADLPALPGTLAPLRAQLDDWLDGLGGSNDDTLAIRFAVLEAVSNVIEHAYPHDAGSVRVEALHDAAGRVCVTITDTGHWAPPPVHPGARGRGIALIRSCMDPVEIDRTANGTTVLMDRQLSRRPSLGPDSVSPRRSAPSGRDGNHFDVLQIDPPQIAIHGPIDFSSVTRLHQRCQEATRGGVLPLTIDLTGVSHLASAGVQLLYQLAEQMAADGRRLQLISPIGTAAHQVLTLTELHQLASVLETVDELPS